MPDLNSLENITIIGKQYGAYYELGYDIQDCGFVSLQEIIQYLIDNSGEGGGSASSLFEYEVSPGCFITATTENASYARTGGAGQNTEGTLSLPQGGIPRGLTIHFEAAQAPGNTFYLNVDRSGTGLSVNGSVNSMRPVLATVTLKPAAPSEGTPAQNYAHTGTPLLVSIVQIDDDGSRVRTRYKIQNYNQQVGANPSILTILFP